MTTTSARRPSTSSHPSTRADTARSPIRPGGMMRRLLDDWSSTARRPAALRRARTWSLGVDFTDLDHLLRLAGFREWPPTALSSIVPGSVASADDSGRPTSGHAAGEDAQAAADSLLGRLLVVARSDELAARIVLQRLLPGLSAAARRWSGDRAGGSNDAFDEIVSAAWLVIRAFPVERRPGHLAAKLLRDAEHHAFVKATRRRWTCESAEPSAFERHVAIEQRTDPSHELAEAVEAARHSLTEHDLRLLELLASGRSIPEVAAALSVSVRTIGYHREALVHRMRAALVA
ncbi:MAG: RNA polymerase sigma factor [Ilumatobacteraceae bacterium]